MSDGLTEAFKHIKIFEAKRSKFKRYLLYLKSKFFNIKLCK